MSWLAWTMPTVIFFISIAVLLIVMTLWELKSPTQLARGFLPMATTRGDRLFISLLSSAFIHLTWLALIGQDLLWASTLSIIWAGLLIRWG